MKKLSVFTVVISVCFSLALSVCAKDSGKNSDTIIKNKMFSISLPQEFKGTYKAKVKKDIILIYHTESQKSGFGGFVFGVKAFEKPSDHAEMPGGRKIGELSAKNGKLYDMVLIQPTDVQYNYIKNPEAPKSYMALYKYGDEVSMDIKGGKRTKYFKNQGMKGEDLYKDILAKHVTAIKEKWDSIKLEQENMSPMYNVIAVTETDVLDKVGYTYYDVNGDGIEELLIGGISDDSWKGIIYDMYTMVDRKPQHVMSGWDRNRYFVCDNVFICNDYSGGSNACGTRVYILVENSTTLFPQVSFKYDGYANDEKPWFLSYGSDIGNEKWENVTEEVFNNRKKIFEQYERFDFIPLSRVTKDEKPDN